MKILILSLFILSGCSASVAVESSNKSSYTSVDKLKTVFHSATQQDIDKFYKALQYAHKFNMTTKMNEDMYLATVLTEVGSNLVGVRENLNYSCDALPKIFSYYNDNGGYNTDGRCNGHAAQQYTIGNKIYANRLGNGSVASGDGYTFRGGGYAQTTGRYNYQTIVTAVNSKLNTDYTVYNFANNITNTYIAQLGGMGYWYQVSAGSCTTMGCVTDKWNYHTESRQEREDNYSWIKGL